MKETVREETPVPKKETARARTQGPWKKVVKVNVGTRQIPSQRKDPKRSAKGRNRRKTEAQKSYLVERKAQLTRYSVSEMKEEEVKEKAKRETRVPGRKQFLERSGR